MHNCKKDILAELAWDPAINATDVGVIVKDGVVTLTGQLTNFAERYAAERAVRRVSGVKALAIDIEVRLSPSYKRSDADIAAAVQRALDWNVVVPDNCIQPKVENGWITLNGEVEWNYQRKAAERAVRDLFGVVGVTNLVKVKPQIAPSDIEKKSPVRWCGKPNGKRKSWISGWTAPGLPCTARCIRRRNTAPSRGPHGPRPVFRPLKTN